MLYFLNHTQLNVKYLLITLQILIIKLQDVSINKLINPTIVIQQYLFSFSSPMAKKKVTKQIVTFLSLIMSIDR